jgi:hypothetical protein
MKLTAEQTTRAIQALQPFTPLDCPVCKHREWGINDYLFEVRDFLGGGLTVDRATVIPLVVLTCRTCSNTLFFNAVQLGVVASAG